MNIGSAEIEEKAVTGEYTTVTSIMRVQDISAGLPSADLVCKVVTVNSKDFTKNGLVMKRYYGILADKSGSINFTAWRDLDIEKDDVIHISDAMIKEWQGIPGINIVSKTKVVKVRDKSILETFQYVGIGPAPKRYSIVSLRPYLSNVLCLCRVMSVEPVEIKIKEDYKTVYKGVMADNTGSIRFTAWIDPGLQKDNVIDIRGASVKKWNKFLELSINPGTKIEHLSSERLPPAEELPLEIDIPIIDLYESEYLATPEFVVRGTILEFKPDSGVVTRCKVCGRTVQGSECMVHGNTDLIKDLRLKAVVDDGMGAVTVFVNKDLSERFIGKSMDDCILEVSKSDTREKGNSQLLSHLLARDVKVKGNLKLGDFNISIFATSISSEAETEPLIKERAQNLLETMG